LTYKTDLHTGIKYEFSVGGALSVACDAY